MDKEKQLRWQQRFGNFKNAFSQLQKACEKENYSELEFAGLIKNFEITFEMAWKTFKDLFEYEGFDVKSPRSTIQQAFSSGYIANPQPWVEALESRNILSHNYDQAAASDAESLIKGSYLPMLRDALVKLQSLDDAR